MNLGCIVMAAGESRRFGANKLLQLFDGKPLYVRALEAVPPGCFASVQVVTGYGPVAELAEQLGFGVVSNDRPELGISRTIRLGMEGLEDCGGILFMTADQPCLSPQTVEKLAAEFRARPDRIVAAACHGKKGNPCLFPKALFPELRQLEGDHGGSRVIRANGELLYLVEVPELELCDCDTAESLQSLQTEKEKLQ